MSNKVNDIDPLVEWAVWGHLDSKTDLELILLKGHLLLENVLETCLSRQKIDEIDNYSFYRKVKELEQIGFENLQLQNFICLSLFNLNKIRNKIAHDFYYEISDGELELWAKKILENLNGMKFSRYTYRTKIVHSFSILAANLLELTKEKTASDK